MAIEHLSPRGLMPAHGYTQVIKATGGSTIYIAGQGAYDESGQLVGPGDHYAQIKQAYRNLRLALAGAGAGPEHVVKSTIYVVRLSDAVLEQFVRATSEEPMPPTAATMVGVQRLAYEEMLVEIDAIAVV